MLQAKGSSARGVATPNTALRFCGPQQFLDHRPLLTSSPSNSMKRFDAFARMTRNNHTRFDIPHPTSFGRSPSSRPESMILGELEG